MNLAAICILTDNAPRLAAFYEKIGYKKTAEIMYRKRR